MRSGDSHQRARSSRLNPAASGRNRGPFLAGCARLRTLRKAWSLGHMQRRALVRVIGIAVAALPLAARRAEDEDAARWDRKPRAEVGSHLASFRSAHGRAWLSGRPELYVRLREHSES